MPRRSILSSGERETLLAMPEAEEDLIRRYTFSETDVSVIRQRRGRANRLGFAVQLCYMRYPGRILAGSENPHAPLLQFVASQLKVSNDIWPEYAQRDETRREHMLELQSVFGFQPFTKQHYRPSVHNLDELAWQTDKGIVLATALVETLLCQGILLPPPSTIERICEAITRANRRVYAALAGSLTVAQRQRLDGLARAAREQQNDMACMVAPVAC
jgi:Domain of unknown function (DUF4158)